MSESELDDALRRKLLSLGERVEAPLAGDAEQRIVTKLQREARLRAERARRLRAGLAVAGVLASAAALTVAWLERAPKEPAPHGQATVTTCAWKDAALIFAPLGEGRQELALGPAGRVVLASGARAKVAQQAGCALQVELSQGALAAKLGDLRPGSLVVRTSLGDVQVRGTTFSVEVGEDLKVALLSGAVRFSSRDQPAVTLAPGKALRRGHGDAPRLSELAPEETRDVARLLSGAPRAEPPSSAQPDPSKEADALTRGALRPRPSGLLGRAESARREGDAPRARALYVQAEGMRNADAEVALLRHAGFELDESRPAAAQALLAEHGRRFPRSRFAAEASWLEVRVHQARGDRSAAHAAARELRERFPGTPQAAAAQRLLDGP